MYELDSRKLNGKMMNSVSKVKASFVNLAIETSKKTILLSMTKHLTRKLTKNTSRWFFCKFA